ncbi:MAG: ATP-binding protein [Trueperaceae bacterium]|nr:ATP-binding protein [Trueperaceae bacterium]
MTYLPRIVDSELRERLRRAGAVLIEGPKASGKTETARQVTTSEVRIDVDPNVRLQFEVDPNLILEGSTPRLIDEWQVLPELWNYVRRQVDDRKATGQFVLTGSANPVEDHTQHTGLGRFSVLRLRPMSLWESGHSTGEVSLRDVLNGAQPLTRALGEETTSLRFWAERLAIGGWPSNHGADLRSALGWVRDYLQLLREVDLSRVSERRRDPLKVLALLQSIARNTATEAGAKTLADDAEEHGEAIDRATVADYLSALTRLMVLEDQPAWSTRLRSSAALRQAPKRHFVDPSLAVAALAASPSTLIDDLEFMGLLFESLVIRDLRVYTQPLDALISHYRASDGSEVDAIINLPNGDWAAVEVKLGFRAVEAAAKSLLRLAAAVHDTVRKPVALIVITGSGFAYQRPDGVTVIPLSALRD